MEHADFVFGLVTDKQKAHRFVSKAEAEKFSRGIKFSHATALDARGAVWIVQAGEFAFVHSILPRPAPEKLTRKKHIKVNWEEASLVARLGKVPDAELAEELGCNKHSVCNARTRMGIPAVYEYRGAYQWTPDMDKMVGTDFDYVIGRELGIGTDTVRKRRDYLGRPPKGPAKLGRHKAA